MVATLLKKPRGRPKKMVAVDMDVPETKPKNLGGRPRKDRPKSLVQVDDILALTTSAPNSDDEADEKVAFRKEARKYAPAMLLNLVDLALNAPHAASRVKATEAVIYMGHGRPSTVQSDTPPISMVPHFTLVFGDRAISTEHNRPNLIIAAPPSDDGD